MNEITQLSCDIEKLEKEIKDKKKQLNILHDAQIPKRLKTEHDNIKRAIKNCEMKIENLQFELLQENRNLQKWRADYEKIYDEINNQYF